MAVRKNQASLAPSEKQAFVNAMLKLKNGTPSQMGLSNRYDDYVQMHMDAMMPGAAYAHGGPAFLPWHREYLRRLELDLQAAANDPSIAIPYWDWTVDRSPTSTLWQPDLLGGNGRASDARVITGPFAFNSGQWTIAVTMQPGGGPDLRRRLGAVALPLPSTSQVQSALQVVPYDAAPWSMSSRPSFRNRLEGWYGAGNIHNRVHLWVGGNMASMASPNDPVFWLHHSNIDRIWAEWQRQHPTLGYLPTSGGPQGHNLNDPMRPWGGVTTPASMLILSALGYSYA